MGSLIVSLLAELLALRVERVEDRRFTQAANLAAIRSRREVAEFASSMHTGLIVLFWLSCLPCMSLIAEALLLPDGAGPMRAFARSAMRFF